MSTLADIMASSKPDIAQLPGGWEPPSESLPVFDDPPHAARVNGALLLRNALTLRDCQKLLYLIGWSPNFCDVSVYGAQVADDGLRGSRRTTLWFPMLAERLWRKICWMLPTTEFTDYLTATDWWQGQNGRDLHSGMRWTPVGITPLLRCMEYRAGAQHFPHYDAGYIYPEPYTRFRTLQSVVFYLTTIPSGTGGATRFIEDGQGDLPIWGRKHEDWQRPAHKYEVLASVSPRAGDVLVFNHRRCHDVELYTGSTPRIIVRADILYDRAYAMNR